MKNKMIEFVREFNTSLGELKQYSDLEYSTNGCYEAISLPQVNLFDDGNYPAGHFRKIALTQLLKVVSDWGEVASNMFADEISAWEKEVRKQLKDRFPQAKMAVMRVATLRYKIILAGKYDEEPMSEFVDVIVQDFEYMFDGCKLNFEY